MTDGTVELVFPVLRVGVTVEGALHDERLPANVALEDLALLVNPSNVVGQVELAVEGLVAVLALVPDLHMLDLEVAGEAVLAEEPLLADGALVAFHVAPLIVSAQSHLVGKCFIAFIARQILYCDNFLLLSFARKVLFGNNFLLLNFARQVVFFGGDFLLLSFALFRFLRFGDFWSDFNVEVVG